MQIVCKSSFFRKHNQSPIISWQRHIGMSTQVCRKMQNVFFENVRQNSRHQFQFLQNISNKLIYKTQPKHAEWPEGSWTGFWIWFKSGEASHDAHWGTWLKEFERLHEQFISLTTVYEFLIFPLDFFHLRSWKQTRCLVICSTRKRSSLIWKPLAKYYKPQTVRDLWNIGEIRCFDSNRWWPGLLSSSSQAWSVKIYSFIFVFNWRQFRS